MPKEWTCSDCCFAPVATGGKVNHEKLIVTNFHVCTECNTICDVLHPKEKELLNAKRILEEYRKHKDRLSRNTWALCAAKKLK